MTGAAARISTARPDQTSTAWPRFYRIGGGAAALAVLTGIVEMIITAFPYGTGEGIETAAEWFGLFEASAFMGMRNLGLLNVGLFTLGIVVYVALWGVLNGREKPWVTLGLVISVVGTAAFFATNRAFPMWALSQQYAAATTEAQRALLEAAGQAMLTVGESHTPGTFFGFALSGLAGLIISVEMLRSAIFSRAASWVGLVGFTCLLIYEVLATFAFGTVPATLLIAAAGGLLSMGWYATVAYRLVTLKGTE